MREGVGGGGEEREGVASYGIGIGGAAMVLRFGGLGQFWGKPVEGGMG
ncbi:hypothetical protein TIFTF001_055232 [Ficus carica]|uniref:Uncharacterized protein n=1 Tax=Ficus carica TaxID=3494 RepID=A0AA88ECR2_FICCA|nr:hypothetical protein TIFTF001_055232 [Ficus carica]